MNRKIILEFDGVLCDTKWREKMKRIDKLKYHSLCVCDPINEEMRGIVQNKKFSDVVYITNRLETFRHETEAWLKRFLGFEYSLSAIFMQSEYFHLPSHEWKWFCVNSLAAGGWFYPLDFETAYDCDKKTVEMYKTLGINAELIK